LDLPGGFINIGETLEDSVKREIREELGVEIEDIKYIYSTSDKYLYQGINCNTLGFLLTGKVKNMNFRIKDEITEIKFFSKDRIPFARLAFKGVKEGIKYYLSSFKESNRTQNSK